MDKEDLFVWNIKVTTLNNKDVGEYTSIENALNSLNLNRKSKGNIGAAISGKRKNAYGYKWYKVKRPLILLKGEVFRYCKDYKNLYAVSNKGRVISTQFHGVKGCKVLSQSTRKYGYKVVKLRIWGVSAKSIEVQRLVAGAFLDNPDNKPQVDHIDTNPSNNNLENLRWVTCKENQNNDKTLNNLRNHLVNYNKSLHHKYSTQIALGIPVSLYEKDGKLIKTFPSFSEAALFLHTSAGSVSRVTKNNTLFRNKYFIKYADTEGIK